MKRQIILGLMLAATLAAAGCQNGAANPFAPGTAEPSGPSAADEGFTINLAAFTDADHVGAAEKSRAATERATGWKGIFVIQEEADTSDNSDAANAAAWKDFADLHRSAGSLLCWGKYRTVAGAKKDLETARQWKSSAGYQPFAGAIIFPLSGSNPGPPEYDLKNATGKYTIVVGVFYDDARMKITGRKQYAVDNAVDLRKKGYEAYFCHGPVTSLVTIGSFGDSSFQTVQKEGMARIVPVDPAVKKILTEKVKLAVNGYEELEYTANPQTGAREAHPKVTYIFAIPHKKTPEAPTSAPSRLGQ